MPTSSSSNDPLQTSSLTSLRHSYRNSVRSGRGQDWRKPAVHDGGVPAASLRNRMALSLYGRLRNRRWHHLGHRTLAQPGRTRRGQGCPRTGLVEGSRPEHATRLDLRSGYSQIGKGSRHRQRSVPLHARSRRFHGRPRRSARPRPVAVGSSGTTQPRPAEEMPRPLSCQLRRGRPGGQRCGANPRWSSSSQIFRIIWRLLVDPRYRCPSWRPVN